jgi:hypothetical protein
MVALQIVILVLLLAASGTAKGIMDASADSKLPWKPQDYWLKRISWVRKWKDGDPGKGPAFGLTEIELFGKRIDLTFLNLHSAGAFSFAADGWHLMQLVSFNGLAIGSALAYDTFGLLGLAAALAVFKVAFQTMYSSLSP